MAPRASASSVAVAPRSLSVLNMITGRCFHVFRIGIGDGIEAGGAGKENPVIDDDGAGIADFFFPD